MKRTTMTEAMKNSIEGMLRNGKATVDIMYELNVSAYHVGKVRRELMKNGWGCLWHTDNYLDQKGFA